MSNPLAECNGLLNIFYMECWKFYILKKDKRYHWCSPWNEFSPISKVANVYIRKMTWRFRKNGCNIDLQNMYLQGGGFNVYVMKMGVRTTIERFTIWIIFPTFSLIVSWNKLCHRSIISRKISCHMTNFVFNIACKQF